MTSDRRPTNLADRLQVHEDMRAVLGPNPEAFDEPRARAVFLLDRDLIRRANQQENP